jgi:hypothetical protein
MYISRIIILCCFVNIVYSIVGNGYGVWSWGTTRDLVGVNTGMASGTSCALSGVAGDLSRGQEVGYGGCGTGSKQSEASVWWTSSGWNLQAHGGACTSTWIDNPIVAQITCFWKGANVEGYWTPDQPSILSINYPVVPGRMCFLSGLRGTEGTWNDPNTYARIRPITVTDYLHPTTGWYIESNLKKSASGSRPGIHYYCMDFPSDHVITTGTTRLISITQTIKLTSGYGIKACALTGVTGAFNVDAWNNGIIMHWPSTSTGDWTLTVTAGKSANWACVQ